MISNRRALRPTRRAVTVAAPALAALMLASACGGKPSVQAEKDASGPIALDEETTLAPADGGALSGDGSGSGNGISGALVAPFELNQTVWFAGFKVVFSTAPVDPADKTLTIEAEAENEGFDQNSLSGDARLEQGGVGIADGRLTTRTTVLAGSRTAASLVFNRVPGTFDPAKAVIVLGDAKHQQVRMALKGQAPSVTGEPSIQADLAPIRVATLTVTIDEVSIRHDDPQGHRQSARDKAFVILEGSARFDGRTTNFQNQNMSLIPPNGSPQSPRVLNALPRQGSSEDIYCVFEMPTPIGGEYTLSIKGGFALDKYNGPSIDASGDTRFTLKVDPPATGSGSDGVAKPGASPTTRKPSTGS
jgi:hypothetical protein